MRITLHKNATTTPAIRTAILAGNRQRLRVGEVISRDSTDDSSVTEDGITPADASHTPHGLPTTLNPGQEELVIELCTQFRLPLDDLLAVIREWIEPSMTRSALGRLLRAPSATPGCLNRKKGQSHPILSCLPAGLLSYGPQIPAPDGGRGFSPLCLRRHRSSDPLGLRGGQAGKDPSGRPQLPPRAGQSGTHQNPNHPHRSRQEEFTDRVFGQEPMSLTRSAKHWAWSTA